MALGVAVALSIPALWDRIGNILGTVTPEEPTTSDTPGMGQTKGHLEKLLSPPIADSPRVNVHESEREQSGISRRQFCGVRRLAAIFRDAHRPMPANRKS